MIQRKINWFLSALFGLLLLACFVVPAFSQDNWKVGDEVKVDAGGGKICNGVIESVYKYPAGNSYSVKYQCENMRWAESVYVEAAKVTPRAGVKKPVESRGNSNPNGSQDTPRKSVEEPEDNDSETGTNVSPEDLDYFFGKWKLSRWGGGSTVEQGDKLYRETLMYVAKAAPITINANGTYTWTIRDGSTVRGKWRRLKPEEDKVAGGKNGLVLLKGFDAVDWYISFMAIHNGKEAIKIYSHLGNFDGERIGASKGEPTWNKIQFAKGDLVIVDYDGEQCNGIIDQPFRASGTGLVTYNVTVTCRTGGRVSLGYVPQTRIRRR